MSASRAWLLAAALGAAALVPGRAAAAPDWELLGVRRVSFAVDRDVVPVGAREGRFTAIKIEVEGGDLEMYDVRVVFTNGAVWSPTTRLRFRERSWSRTIDLPGQARGIRRIEFRYRSEVRRGRAVVRVFGREAAPAPPPRPVAAWERIGSRQVSFAVERDVIPVATSEPFTALKLEVSGGNLELYNIRITFGDGEVWAPNMRVTFREGSWSRTVDLPGEARVIRRIEFRYRSQVKRGQATMHVFGRAAAPSHRPTPPDDSHGAPHVPGWEAVGTTQVSLRADHDVVNVVGRGAFRRIRFDVADAAIEMSDVRVTFSNGETFSPQTRLVFRAGTRSREIAVPGGARVIRRIDFRYRTLETRPGGRATVHVYARR